MVWLNRTPFDLLTDFDRLAAAAVDRMARVAWPSTAVDAPRANVHLAEDEAGVELLIPGYGPEHVQVHLERDLVIVQGERREGEGDAARVVASFERRFKLPFEVDADSVQAKLEHGVLRIALRRTPASAKRTIPVQ